MAGRPQRKRVNTSPPADKPPSKISFKKSQRYDFPTNVQFDPKDIPVYNFGNDNVNPKSKPTTTANAATSQKSQPTDPTGSHNLKMVKPIFIEKPFTEVKTIVDRLQLNKATKIKILRGTTEVICTSIEEKSKLIAELKTIEKLNHYTFSEPQNKPLVFALKGFYNVEESEMKDYITATLKEEAFDITPSKVSRLIAKAKQTASQHDDFSPVYMVQFMKDTKINISLLKHHCKAINQVIVS